MVAISDNKGIHMPLSKTRKTAETKKKQARQAEVAQKQAEKKRQAAAPGSRRWVPPVFIAVGLLGVLWLVVYYLAGWQIPFMGELGGWNILIGMGLMAASFAIATLWK